MKQRRKNPNVLFPGDELVIPDRTEGTAAAATGRLTTFETGTNDVLLNLTFENAGARALASRPGKLTVGGRSVNGDLVKKGPIPLSTDPACTLPLTGVGIVDRVLTDLGVFEPAGDAFRVVELAPGVDRELVIESTAAALDWSSLE